MQTEAPIERTNSLAMEFVRIEAGEFLQGSPMSAGLREENESPHLVRITRPFWMGITHVTVGQFSEFAKTAGYQTLAEEQGWSYGAWNVDLPNTIRVETANRSPEDVAAEMFAIVTCPS